MELLNASVTVTSNAPIEVCYTKLMDAVVIAMVTASSWR